jgi:DNA-binding CsgD family transcriptional regulator
VTQSPTCTSVIKDNHAAGAQLWGDLAERFAAAQPPQPYGHVAALVARCQALVADDVDDAAAAFGEALRRPAAAGVDPLAAARTRLMFGMRLRRAGRRVDARAHLHAARVEFLAMDQTLWVRRADELAGTGERTHSRARSDHVPLTSRETRVALLVAKGMTDKEVAASLFLSPRTVEHHLGAVLRKRGLRSRTELAHALADATGSER